MTQFIDKVPLETQEVANQVKQLLEKFKDYKIVDNVEYQNSADILKEVKSKFNLLEKARKSATDPLRQSIKVVTDWFSRPKDIITKIENIVRQARLTYQRAEEAKRKAEEDRLAEIKRKEAEKLAKRADKAEEKGQVDKAEGLREQAQQTEMFTPSVASTIQKTEGVSIRTNWKYQIMDVNLIPRSFMIPDEVKIGKTVRATSGTLEIPGIKIYSEKVEAVKV